MDMLPNKCGCLMLHGKCAEGVRPFARVGQGSRTLFTTQYISGRLELVILLAYQGLLTLFINRK